MRKLYSLSVALFTCLCVSSQVVTIPDANFKAKLLEASPSNQIAKNLNGDFFKIDVNNDLEIQVTEAMQVSYLDVQRDFSIPDSPFISSLEGILSFGNLQDLNCTNNQMASLNVSGLTSLINLDCSGNQLTTMNLTGLTNLQSLICAGTGNQFGTLNLTALTNLRVFICAFNGLSSLNLTGLTNLETLSCGFNNFTTLDVSSLTNLQALYCSSVSALTSLDVSGLANLQELGCSNNFGLQELHISGNQLTTLDLNFLPNLVILEVTNNPLTTLNLSNLTSLQNLDCSGNQLTSLFINNGANEASLNMDDNPDLIYVCVDPTQISTVQTLITSYGYTNCVVNSACSSSEVVTISDANFKSKLLEANPTNEIARNLNGEFFTIDANNDSEIQQSEAAQVSSLDVKESNIASMEGVSAFTNLLYLNCRTNQLTVLNVIDLTNLQVIRCSENQLTALNFTGLTNLLELHCSDNQLTALDLDEFTTLEALHCSNNLLTTLNVNGLPNLAELHCSENLLQSLFIKNGIAEELEINFNMQIEYICADDFQLTDVQNIINMNDYSNCNVNTYCSFTPGGTFYTITGTSRIDSNGNGCEVTDMSFPNSKFTIANGSSTDTVIANTAGDGLFSFSVEEGTHTIIPVLENPSYFTVTPSTVTVTFPTQSSPFTQNFCYTPNGVHHDLEVSMIPMNAAVPGFSAVYAILYKNKGNQTQSGTVTFYFDETQITDIWSWNFTDLKPFETRLISLHIGINTPMDTPPVNGGDVLNYLVTITSQATDETPNDNTFALNQTVVNSFDPNDKTCLEGETITTNEVGGYVHYMIRFENTGTYPAQIIVVKDMIDTDKFDVSSLVPVKGSHDYYTNIKENKVEFIFENINLPFDDANNDGYVVFKIKTKPALVKGDTFSNTASIYFDYNFPIETNAATTTIKELKTQDFGFSGYFLMYPNPVKDVLNIETLETVKVSSINIYNQLGQLVLVIPSAQDVSKVDVSDLASGNYFIKINSDKGTSNTKFIKE
ncbi:hypothetical protein FLJC2902T_31340 [Flavobacterium limnosediminis JC2902]|uniref:Uncharacterized protein n=1 Tax=Flavobacterium limnosediminis JC2902 TaxID=1341181 RepID=V6SFH1_9FLAO|nr:T9SS type A sorting domain-containing protein [Flavobacterium limnosediminis]ESU25326.1 hypothetical protein FLJC2902T_31340 [Flavobacterium limnosediminis JC2902]